MTYSKRIQKKLDEKNISPMDKIHVKKKNKTYKGRLMPNTDMSDPESLIIKLNNGYNVGIAYEDETQLKKIKEREKTKTRPEINQDKSKPPISIISTGGTISSRIDYETGGVKPSLTAEEIVADVPEVTDHAYIRNYEQVTQVTSEDMSPSVWVKIAKSVEKELNEGSRGVIITHGTDTMHYTSAALSFMLDTTKPVILTGSQRSVDRGSTDAAMNLECASIAAAQSNIGEVGIVMHATMNDDYCYYIRGTNARKMHTSRRDTFRPINDLPIAKINPNGKIKKLQDHDSYKDKKTVSNADFEERIAILKIYPGSDPWVIDYYEDKEYKGYIIEGTGLGHVPTQAQKTWIPEMKNVINKGKIVIGTSQCMYGRINPNVYANLRKLYHEAGAIPGENMTTETAYAKLGWLLATEENTSKVKEKIKKNLKGEITKRSIPKTFLY